MHGGRENQTLMKLEMHEKREALRLREDLMESALVSDHDSLKEHMASGSYLEFSQLRRGK